MSTVPAEIAGIGPTSQKLRATPGFDPLKSGLGPEEYFVLSRIDGSQTIREVLLATGLPIERGVAIVRRLREVGALMLPSEQQPPIKLGGPTMPRAATAQPVAAQPQRAPTAQPVPAPTGRAPTSQPVAQPAPVTPRAPTAQPVPTRAATSQPVAPQPQPRAATQVEPAVVWDLPNPTADEMLAMNEPDLELTTQERLMILALRRIVDRHDPHMMLGVSQGADPKQLKRAYFRLSKDIHPDRYYGQKLGSFRDKLATVFESVSRAYARLTSGELAHDGSGSYRAVQASAQTPQEYAAELFERACDLEIGGQALEGMKLFAAAVRIDAQVRYLRRAASCALAANQPKSALEYAKKAQSQTPNDPSSARLLAHAFRSCGKLADAEEVLIMAMAMKSENDVLTSELRYDLAEVRRLLNS